MADELRSGVTQIFSTQFAFAALKNDGSVVTWGHPTYGGNSNGVAAQLSSNVTQIFANAGAFAALKQDGSTVTWGVDSWGGNSSAVTSQLKNVVAFANPFTDDRLVLGGGAASFTISGTPAVGNTLVASVGAPDPDGNGAFTYNWQTSTDGSSWSPVGTNSSSYLVVSADQGKQLRLDVSYTDGKGFSEAVTTAAGSVPFVNDGAAIFSISGTPAVGNTLSVSTSSPDPEGNGSFTYTWQTSADGSSWSRVGANSSDYTIPRSDASKQLRALISYTDGKGFAESVSTLARTIPSNTTLSKREIVSNIQLSAN